MSSVSSRSKANSVKSVGAPAGAVIAGVCLVGLAKLLSVAAKTAFDQVNKPIPENKKLDLKSVSQIRTETKQIKPAVVPGKSIETIKGQVLSQIASQPFMTTDTIRLENKVSALAQAKTLAELESAKIDLISALEVGHQQIFTDTLIGACQKAAFKVGFAKIEPLPSPLSSVVRFSATDALGRTLVTEVSAPKDRDVRVETEVVGVSDGSCITILDDFDNALEAEGVRSQPPKRKYTGGICETAAVRDFLEKKIKPTTAKTDVTENFASTDDVKRTRRLNQKTQIQRQK